MRKLIALICAMALMCALTGCNTNATKNSTEPTTSTVTVRRNPEYHAIFFILNGTIEFIPNITVTQAFGITENEWNAEAEKWTEKEDGMPVTVDIEVRSKNKVITTSDTMNHFRDNIPSVLWWYEPDGDVMSVFNSLHTIDEITYTATITFGDNTRSTELKFNSATNQTPTHPGDFTVVPPQK
jgi:hypothetical protein